MDFLQVAQPMPDIAPAVEPEENVWLGTGKSFLSALVPETLGMRPSEGVQAFRSEHPGIGLGTQLAGMLGGYAAGAGLASTGLRAIPRIGPAFARTVAGLGVGAAESAVAPAVQSAIARGALREALQVAPFEAVRIATAATVEDAQQARDIAAQSIINIGATAAIGAGLRAFAESRPAKALAIRGEELAAKTMADYNVAEATQEKLAKLRIFSNTEAFRSKISEGDRANIHGLIERFQQNIETEWPKVNPIGRLRKDKTDNAQLGKLFARVRGAAEAQGPYATYKISELGKVRGLDPAVRQEMGNRLKDVLQPGWHQHAQFPTLVRPRGVEGAQKVAQSIKRNLTPVDSVRGWYMGRETGENGLFVMARKIRGGAAPSDGDLWLTLKSNSPRGLLPHYDAQLRDLERASFAMRDSPAVAGIEIRGKAKDPTGSGRTLPGEGIGLAKEAKPLFDAMLAPEAMYLSLGTEAQREMRFLSLLPKELVDDIAVGARNMGTSLKRYLAPSTARASTISEGRMLQTARGVAALTHKRVVDTFAGKLPKGATGKPRTGGLFKQIGEKRVGGILPLLKDVAKRNSDDLPTLGQLTQAIDTEMTLAEASQSGFDGSVIRLLEHLRKLRLDKDRELILAREAYGFTGPEMIFKDTYYHIAKTFRGNLRLPIHQLNKDGTLGAMVDIASGGTRSTVMREAEAIKGALKEKGIQVHWPVQAGTGLKSRVDLPLLAPYTPELDGRLMSKLDRSAPGYRAARDTRLQFYKRPKVPGRLMGSSLPDRVSFGLRPLTEKELGDRIFSSLLEHERFVGEMMLRGKYLKPEMSRLAGMTPEVVPGGGFWKTALDMGQGESPLAANTLSNTIIKLFGADPPGSFSKMVDDVSTNVVGMPLSSITRSVNQGMFHLMLGAGDVGFPALNVLSVIQAAMPEVAYVGRAPTNILAPYYSIHLLRDGKGMIRPYHALDPLKFAWRALKDIRNPTPELRKALTWAAENDAIAPRLVEEFAGAMDDAVRLAGVRSGQTSFSTWLANVNKFMPAKSEEFSRLWSFLMGKRAAEDFFGQSGEEALRFAKLFTEKTMFNYGAADRAAITTGPIGGFWGLFKNWTMHYLWNMYGYGKHAMAQKDLTPLLWAMGSTGAIGGATAVPGYFLLDNFAKMVSNQDMMGLTYGALEEDGDSPFVDTFFYGLPSFLGMSLTGRAQAPGADPIRDLNTFFSIATLDRASQALKLPAEMIDLFATTGELPGQSRQVMDHFMRATMPRTVYRFQQAAAEEGIRSLSSGNLLVKDPNMLQRVAFVLGITPLEVQKHFDVAAEGWRQTEKMKETVRILGEEGSEYMEARDNEGFSNLIRRAYTMGVNPNAVVSSARANYNNKNMDLVERQFTTYQQRKMARSALGTKD